MSEAVQPAPAEPEGPGERFGDYVLIDRIAQGGMAELFLAKRRGVEGFEKTVEQVAGIEKQLGIYDLDQFTPKAAGK